MKPIISFDLVTNFHNVLYETMLWAFTSKKLILNDNK